MKRTTRNRIISIFVLLLIFVVIVTFLPNQDQELMRLYKDIEHDLYLPVVVNNYRKKPIAGVELFGSNWEKLGQYYDGDILKVSIQWDDVEHIRGVYYWDIPDSKIGSVDKLMLGFRGAPQWANGGQLMCKLPLPIYYQDYINFVIAGIERYQPDYVEIWNEPDALHNDPYLSYYYGCIGKERYHGEQYGYFFNVVYAQVKAQYPDVIILGGALMNVNWPFVDGFLDVVGDGIDGISFHIYTRCNADYISYADLQIETIDQKTDKPIYLSETSLIYNEPSEKCENLQADYFRQKHDDVRIETFVWFTLGKSGWMNSDLLRLDFSTKPVYEEYLNRR